MSLIEDSLLNRVSPNRDSFQGLLYKLRQVTSLFLQFLDTNNLNLDFLEK